MFYEILQVPNNVTTDQLKSAYRKKALYHHPDRCGGDTRQFQHLQKAYETLSTAHLRQAYDREHQIGGAGANKVKHLWFYRNETDVGEMGCVDTSFDGWTRRHHFRVPGVGMYVCLQDVGVHLDVHLHTTPFPHAHMKDCGSGGSGGDFDGWVCCIWIVMGLMLFLLWRFFFRPSRRK